ncbi:MAG: tetratricopeptide repeat protein [Bryobacteraceae bacterium]|nr:tetratricopeptide repeat protein [Bryobacteraceae bacterium]
MPDTTHPPRTAAQWHSAALRYLEQGLLNDAVKALRLAVELDPRNARAWNDFGVVLEALGNRRDAVHCYRQALRAAPELEEPKRNLMMLALEASLMRSVEMPRPVRSRAALAVAR